MGDVVTYAPTTKPDAEETVQITVRTTDINKGIIAQTTPLAQLLLDAVVGDEVVLRVPSRPPQNIRG